MRRRRLLASSALLALMGGCASLAPPSQSDAIQPSSAARPYHNTIELGGRISVRYQGERKEEALHGSYLWSQTPDRTGVTLLSPLGQTLAVIDVSAQGASLRQAGQPDRVAPDVDTLTLETLGWPLPVAGLRNWLQGFALDASGNRFMATPGHAEVRTRDGWQLHYPVWEDSHPKRIDLSRFTDHAGEVSIRIVIDSWQAP